MINRKATGNTVITFIQTQVILSFRKVSCSSHEIEKNNTVAVLADLCFVVFILFIYLFLDMWYCKLLAALLANVEIHVNKRSSCLAGIQLQIFTAFVVACEYRVFVRKHRLCHRFDATV